MAKILIAEDDHSMRGFLKLALEKAGHDVTAAADGIEALSHLKQDSDFALLLADIVMPGMDGIELSQHAADILPDLKIMFITGFAAVAMNSQSYNHAAAPDNTPIMSKPFHLKDLVNQIDDLLAA